MKTAAHDTPATQSETLFDAICRECEPLRELSEAGLAINDFWREGRNGMPVLVGYQVFELFAAPGVHHIVSVSCAAADAGVAKIRAAVEAKLIERLAAPEAAAQRLAA